MRYQLEMEIGAPRARVVELFLDPANLKKWQPDLVSFEQIGFGAPRGAGAKSKQVHRMGKREMEMLETITINRAPEEFAATYEAEGVLNLITNRFSESPEGKTRWVLDSEFKFSSFLMKLVAFVFPGMFKKQTLTFMQRFKQFVEQQ